MAEELDDNIPANVPPVPDHQTRDLPDLSSRGDWFNKGHITNWDRANIDGAVNREKQWGHAGIPPEQPVDKTNDNTE